MITSLFVVNAQSDVLLEKHYREPLSRSVLDGFYEAVAAGPADGLDPVIPSGKCYLVNVFRHDLSWIAVVQRDVNAVFVVTFLHRIVSILEDYIGRVTEKSLHKEVVTVYRVLEEMLDNGFPLATEPNVLMEMIKPPSWSDAVSLRKKVRDTLPTGQLTATMWRRSGVKYSNNEVFVDILEHVDAIVDRQGTTVAAEIQGVIKCKCRLSGMPDLSLIFTNPRLMDEVSLHPCVRIQRWESENILSFVPPDGTFELASYVIGAHNQIALPIYVRPNISYMEGGGKIDIEVGPKQTQGKVVERVVLTIPMPKAVNDVNVRPHLGSWNFDQITKTLVWDIGKLNKEGQVGPVTLKGSLSLSTGEPIPDSTPSINVSFKVANVAMSGLVVNRLELTGERYKPFKGVKYNTESGNYQVRA
eukprot:m.115944 g.115944  ORF g.115944 m.115944 type:complete len:415 (+) comp16361_c0_seq1:491-1735(+)